MRLRVFDEKVFCIGFILAHDSSGSLLSPCSSPLHGAIRELRCPSRWLSLICFRVTDSRMEEQGNEEAST